MKNLFLIRHAQPVVDNLLDDKERPLTLTGIIQCEGVAKEINNYGIFPDFVLCSAALRTKQTAEHILRDLSQQPKIEYTDNLYYASAGNIYEAIKQIDNKYQNLMIITHNPSVSNLAHILANGESQKKFLSTCINFAPADLILYQFSVNKWKDIEVEQGNILWTCRT